jgi:hypothetical protein
VHDGDELVLLHVFHSAGLTFADLQEEKKEAVRMLEGALESAKAVLLPPRSVEISTNLIESDDVRQTLTNFCRNYDYVVVGSLGNSGGNLTSCQNFESDFAQESARFCWAQCLNICCRIAPRTFWSSDSSESPSKVNREKMAQEGRDSEALDKASAAFKASRGLAKGLTMSDVTLVVEVASFFPLPSSLLTLLPPAAPHRRADSRTE